MKILITGGTGLIGLAFIQKFNQHQFTILTRTAKKSEKILPKSVNLIETLEELANLDEFDAVINLAGEAIIGKRWSKSQKQIICDSRWNTTKQLVELFACSQHPPEVFLSGSAIGIYSNRADEILTENSVITAKDFPAELCLKWEKIAEKASPFTRVIQLRTGIVLSTAGGALAKMLLPFKYCIGGKIGNGQQYMSWIHYQDQINAMHYLLTEKNISGVVNLTAPEPEPNSIFSKTLAKKLKRPAILPAPKKILQYILGESSCLLLDSQRVKPQKLLESSFKFKFKNLDKALEDLLKSK